MVEKPGVFFFKRLGGKKKGGGGGGGWWKLKSSGLRWKGLRFRIWFVDGFLFKILSVCEAIVVVANLCFFYLCCGCRV
ncbi:hypothetical protein Vadar_034140 [Vaccinium darrowii]|uniref:Uncharacterized protein n=1 Tax=Vaccinium darrowii TaxID=229202 RepID=A0ACB7Y561_9ERIC|nr:hypothetical protein Vadar_034140 [Vaccinium darrowii]